MNAVALLTRHLLSTMARQRARTLVLWLALTVGLAVVVGLLSFVRSVEDSYQRRGAAIGGIADVRVEAIAQTALPPRLAARLERVEGTRDAIAMTRQRVSLQAGGRTVVATAFGIDRRARLLRSTLERELRLGPGRAARRGLTLSRTLAGRLGVKRGDRVRLFAFAAAPRLRVARVVAAADALADVVVLPRGRLEALRGAPGRPTVVYVTLAAGTSLDAWTRRARAALPPNAVVTTSAAEQGELDHVLDFTVRSPTFVFGSVVLAIVALLVYVLQLMRMLERQEDTGLVRALGAGRIRLGLAEGVTLTLLVGAAVLPGTLAAFPIAQGLAEQVPTYLTDVFGFDVRVAISPGVVAVGAVLALLIGLVATGAALLSLRGPVAEQLGRSPQAGATVTSHIGLGAALALLAGGAAALAAGALLSDAGAYPPATLATLAGLGLATPGLVGLAVLAIGRSTRGRSRTLLVARAALEANPRRAALAAAIMALGIAAAIPPQLVSHALQERVDALTASIRPDARQLVASDDAYSSVPMTLAHARRALRAGADTAPSTVSFVPFRGRKLELRALDPQRAHPVFATGQGIVRGFPLLRRQPNGVLVSHVLTAGLGLGAGDRIELPTAHGPRALRIVGEVEDMSWPSGTVYMTNRRYRALYDSAGANLVAVAGPGMLRREGLRALRPVHTISGAELARRVHEQMDRSTRGLAAMRALTLLAALVAVAGILATSVFARRREWAVLRAMGMSGGGLLAALGLETLLVMAIGAVCGTVGGILSFRGTMLAFMRDEGYVLSDALLPGTLALVVTGAVLAATLAAAIPAFLTARARLADTLAYE